MVSKKHGFCSLGAFSLVAKVSTSKTCKCAFTNHSKHNEGLPGCSQKRYRRLLVDSTDQRPPLDSRIRHYPKEVLKTSAAVKDELRGAGAQ